MSSVLNKRERNVSFATGDGRGCGHAVFTKQLFCTLRTIKTLKYIENTEK